MLEMGGEGPVGARHGAYSPSALLSAVQRAHPSFRGGHQQDAHELFVSLLGTLEDEEQSFIKRRVEDAKAVPKQDRDGRCDKEDVAGVGVDGSGKAAAAADAGGGVAGGGVAGGGVPLGTSSADHKSVSASASGDGVASGGDDDGGYKSSGGAGRGDSAAATSDKDGASPVLPGDGDEKNEGSSTVSGRPAVSDAATAVMGGAIDSEGRKLYGEDRPAMSPAAEMGTTGVTTDQSCGGQGVASKEEASSFPPVPETAKERRARFKAQRRERQRLKKGGEKMGNEGGGKTSNAGGTTDDSFDGEPNILSTAVPPPPPPPPPPALPASLKSPKEARPAVTEVFGGFLASVVTCATCGVRSLCREPTSCLSLQIPPKKEGKTAGGVGKAAASSAGEAAASAAAAAATAAAAAAAAAAATKAKVASEAAAAASVGDGKPGKSGLGRGPSGRKSNSLTSVLPGVRLCAKERRKMARQERERLRSMSSENEAAKMAKDTTGMENQDDKGSSALGSDCSHGSDGSVGSVSAESDNPADSLVGQPTSDHGQSPDDVNLYSCLDHFTAAESLVAAEGNGYNCERCRSSSSSPGAAEQTSASTVKQDAKKRMLMTGEPAGVLVCHLKRLQGQKKEDRRVDFPEELDIAPYFWRDVKAPRRASEMQYRLFGVVEHRGCRAGGHYVGYVRDEEGWRYASDTAIRPASLKEVKNAKAYMLLYEQCDQRPVSKMEGV